MPVCLRNPRGGGAVTTMRKITPNCHICRARAANKKPPAFAAQAGLCSIAAEKADVWQAAANGRRTKAYFAVLINSRLFQIYCTPEISVTAATAQHST